MPNLLAKFQSSIYLNYWNNLGRFTTVFFLKYSIFEFLPLYSFAFLLFFLASLNHTGQLLLLSTLKCLLSTRLYPGSSFLSILNAFLCYLIYSRILNAIFFPILYLQSETPFWAPDHNIKLLTLHLYLNISVTSNITFPELKFGCSLMPSQFPPAPSVFSIGINDNVMILPVFHVTNLRVILFISFPLRLCTYYLTKGM